MKQHYVKCILWHGKYRYKSDPIWTDSHTFDDEVEYRRDIGISMMQDRD